MDEPTSSFGAIRVYCLPGISIDLFPRTDLPHFRNTIPTIGFDIPYAGLFDDEGAVFFLDDSLRCFHSMVNIPRIHPRV